MIPMFQRPSPDVFSQLDHLAKRFAHWRHHRPSPKSRIPQELWDEAASLTTHLTVSRVAKYLGLCTADLKKHCPASPMPPSNGCDEPPIHFVDVTPTSSWPSHRPQSWPSPAVEVDLKRADGTHLHLAYHQGAPPLRELVRAFLESI
jgi:hypothetical protein